MPVRSDRAAAPPATLTPWVPPALATLDELKQELGRTGASPEEDAALQRILNSVSSRVESYTGRKFTPNPALADDGTDTNDPVTVSVPLRRTGGWDPAVQAQTAGVWPYPPPRTIDIPDAREITAVQFEGVTPNSWEPIGDLPYRRLALFGAASWALPVNSLPKVLVTGRFGLWPTPPDILDAVLVMAARRWKERDANYADVAMLQDGATVNYFKQFSPTIKATLDSYRRTTRLS